MSSPFPRRRSILNRDLSDTFYIPNHLYRTVVAQKAEDDVCCNGLIASLSRHQPGNSHRYPNEQSLAAPTAASGCQKHFLPVRQRHSFRPPAHMGTCAEKHSARQLLEVARPALHEAAIKIVVANVMLGLLSFYCPGKVICNIKSVALNPKLHSIAAVETAHSCARVAPCVN